MKSHLDVGLHDKPTEENAHDARKVEHFCSKVGEVGGHKHKHRFNDLYVLRVFCHETRSYRKYDSYQCAQERNDEERGDCKSDLFSVDVVRRKVAERPL